MNAQERRILYRATQALTGIAPAKDDRALGAAAYSRDMKEAIPIFNEIVWGLLSDDGYSTQIQRVEKLEAIYERSKLGT